MGLRIRPMPDVSAVLFCRVGEDLCFAAGFAALTKAAGCQSYVVYGLCPGTDGLAFCEIIHIAAGKDALHLRRVFAVSAAPTKFCFGR